MRAATQGRMALQGAVNLAIVLDGPVERIEAEVRVRIWQLGRNGGYFCCEDQALPYPPEHLAALRRAVEKYGTYPLGGEQGGSGPACGKLARQDRES